MRHARPRHAFTLIELLVVITIVLCVALIAIPVFNTLNGRQVTDAARIFSGALVGARDSAIRYNEMRGVRLLPDPVLTIPAPGLPGAGTTQLVYNRMIPIEPAGDYYEGRITIGPQIQYGAVDSMPDFPPFYAYPDMPAVPVDRYPFPSSPKPPNSPSIPSVLMIEAAPFKGGYATTGEPRAPTNWYWNVRVGDKIKINGVGRAYTIIGPCTINPWRTGVNQGNPEMFVNVGAPGTASPLIRTYTATLNGTQTKEQPEFLFLVNSTDDDKDGYVDEGFDGSNNNPPEPSYSTVASRPTDNLLTDEPFEWEIEAWQGVLTQVVLNDQPVGTQTDKSPSDEWVTNNAVAGNQDLAYSITRRPVPSPGAREVMLPAGMAIDATGWNLTRERSRIPITPGSLYCDVMVNPNGLYVPTTQYSSPTSADTLPFLHFWITSREDVYPIGSLTDSTGKPITATSATQAYLLPMSSDTPGYPAIAGWPTLKGDRRLVTMFAQSGLVTTNTIETVAPPSNIQAGEGFSTTNVNQPYLRAQQGLREAR